MNFWFAIFFESAVQFLLALALTLGDRHILDHVERDVARAANFRRSCMGWHCVVAMEMLGRSRIAIPRFVNGSDRIETSSHCQCRRNFSFAVECSRDYIHREVPKNRITGRRILLP
jgi:hypothetical protein